MTRLNRTAALAASLIALGALTACGAGSPSGTPATSVSESGEATASASPTSAPVAAANLDGTVFFLGVGAAGGIYYLHNNTLTLAVSDASFGFFQSATMSPDGTKLAWILSDSAGGTGQMRVQTYGGGSVTIGPATINNGYPPQWSANSSSMIVGYGPSGWAGSTPRPARSRRYRRPAGAVSGCSHRTVPTRSCVTA